MKKILIKTEKQSNGLWSTPINCVSIDSIPHRDNEILFSALVIAIGETYNHNTFKVFLSSEGGFKVSIDGHYFTVVYDKYAVIDNILYDFDNEYEKKIFLRKQKLNNLKNELYNSVES